MKLKDKFKYHQEWKKILKDLRKERGITQKELSERCKIHPKLLSEYENIKLKGSLSLYVVETILDALGYELEVLLKEPPDFSGKKK
mgnify:CR=1 FL=1